MNKLPGFLLFNAASGTAGKLTPADLLAKLPPGTKLHEFVDGDDPVQLAREAVFAGAGWVAVAGGDGTVEAVAGALVDTPVPLGVIAWALTTISREAPTFRRILSRLRGWSGAGSRGRWTWDL